MAAQDKLSKEIVHAEFPLFELFRSFWPFNLHLFRKTVPDRHQVEAAFQRLCSVQVVNANKDEALDAYFAIVHAAASEYKRCKNNFVAFREVLTKIHRNRDCSAYFQSLTQLLVRLGGWGGSTSGCERLLSKYCRASNVFRALLKEARAGDVACLLCFDPEQDDLYKILQYAQNIWADVYGNTRLFHSHSHRSSRRDKGRPKNTSNSKSEAAWIRQRRKSVGDLVQTHSAPQADPDEYWGEGHDKECLFQHTKQHLAKLQALEDGLLRPCEVTQTMQDDLNVMQLARAKNHLELTNQHAKHNLQLQTHTPNTMIQRVFVQQLLPEHTRQIHKMGMRVAEREQADLIIVNDMRRIGQRNTWHLFLSGGVVANVEYLMSGLRKGNSLTFKPAIE